MTLAACATATTHPPAPAPAVVDLAVVTWNMHVGAGNLQALVSDLADGHLTSVRPANYVLLLQEVIEGGPHDPAAIARAGMLSVVFEPVRRRPAGTTGNAILSTVTLTNARQIALPRARQPRAALVASITLAGHDLFVADAHLENRVSVWRGLLFSDGPRTRQAKAVIEALPQGHGIAGGDLNTWLGPEEGAWKVFAARFPDTPAGPTDPTVRDRLALDHLFFDLPDGWHVTRHVVTNQYGSDHHPVVAVISGVS